MTIIWTPEDSAAALAQGWEIFSTNRDDDWCKTRKGLRYGHRPYELQRDDDAEIFANDDEAWTFVWLAGLADDPVATRALVFLMQNSPVEYAAIRDFCEAPS